MGEVYSGKRNPIFRVRVLITFEFNIFIRNRVPRSAQETTHNAETEEFCLAFFSE